MADKAAKLALNMPLIYTQILSTKDINKFLKQQPNETKRTYFLNAIIGTKISTHTHLSTQT